jgi:hypothetical protein
MTPEEKYSSNVPDISHLRIFGCLVFLHIPKEKRNKLDSKTKRCLFLGYDNESKASRLFDATTRKIFLSRDVIFDKNRIGYHHVLETSILPDNSFPTLDSDSSLEEYDMTPNLEGSGKALTPNCETIPGPTFSELPSHDTFDYPLSPPSRATSPR